MTKINTYDISLRIMEEIRLNIEIDTFIFYELVNNIDLVLQDELSRLQDNQGEINV